MRLLLTGGGTLGSVTPLLALAEILQTTKTPSLHTSSLSSQERVGVRSGGGVSKEEFFWIGTKHGVEETLVRTAGIPYRAIVSGKLRRYWDARTLLAPFVVFIGFVQAFAFLVSQRRLTSLRDGNDRLVVIGAGSYVQVPVIWAAWVLRIPSYTIQLDVLPGLANRLVAPFVRTIFTVFEDSTAYFPKRTVRVVGSCVRPVFAHAMESARAHTRPLVVALGGGTGAASLNVLVRDAAQALGAFCDVVHLTGKGKRHEHAAPYYTTYEFLGDELAPTLAAADVVITRAGIGTLSELAALKKTAIVIPLPESPQEENARVLAAHNAIVLCAQKVYTPEQLVEDVRALLSNAQRREEIGERLHFALPTDGAEKIGQYLKSQIRMMKSESMTKSD